MKSSRLKIGIALIVVAAVLTAMFTLPVKEYLSSFVKWVEDYPVLGPVLLGIVYVLATVLFIPGSILTLGAGAAFGLLKGFIVVSAASVTGASIAFLLGRTLMRDWVTRKVEDNPKFKAVDQAIGQNAFKMILLIRLSPIFPFNLLNYMFGLTRASFRDHLFASWIGMIPGTILYVAIGAGIGGVFSKGGTGEKVLWIVALLATVGVTMLITRVAKKALDQAVEATPQEI